MQLCAYYFDGRSIVKMCYIWWKFASSRPDWQKGVSFCFSIHAVFRPSIYLSTNLGTIFWKQTNRFWCKLALVVHRARAHNFIINFEIGGGSKIQAYFKPKYY